jgi:hypothetical protein
LSSFGRKNYIQIITPRQKPNNQNFMPLDKNSYLHSLKEFGFGGGDKKSASSTGPSGTPGGSSGGGGQRGGLGGPFGGGGGGQRSGNDDDESPYKIEFSVNVRNLFNRTNRGTPIGNLRSQLFGQSVSLAGGFGFGGGGGQAAGNRRIELEVSFSF